MLKKNNFKNSLSITQGRHLKKIGRKIQLFPEKDWRKELKLFNKTKLKFIEWVVSKDNYNSNPLCSLNGYHTINKNLKKNKIKCRSVDLDFIVKENPLRLSKEKIDLLLDKIKIISNNSLKVGIKYLIFPFLENASPQGKVAMKKLFYILENVKKLSSNKLTILVETDLKPKNVLKIVKKMRNKIFINYDIGNSASKNYNFEEEKKYFKFVKNIHLKDRLKNGSTIRFGYGNANFNKLFKYLKKNKYNYDFTLQPARSKCNKDIKEIKLNIKYIEKLLINL